jgi:signal transduction histidine kinase
VAISCQLRNDVDDLTDGGADAAFRVVQEAITNAMKHAPGAPIEVTVNGGDGGVEIRVVNGPADSGPSGLEHTGGGHGLAGMRERMSQCGGTFMAGPTSAGGWQLAAHFPHRMAVAPATLREGA